MACKGDLPMENQPLSPNWPFTAFVARVAAGIAGLACSHAFLACSSDATDSTREAAQVSPFPPSGSGAPTNGSLPVLAASDRSCAANADCALTFKGCCEVSGRVAMRADKRDAFVQAVAKACSQTPCDLSEPVWDTATSAACVNGSCEEVNPRNEKSVAGCTTDQDCKLRAAQCCPCGELKTADLIAISSDVAYSALACSGPCDKCDVTYEHGTRAYCDHGMCAVAAAPQPQP